MRGLTSHCRRLRQFPNGLRTRGRVFPLAPAAQGSAHACETRRPLARRGFRSRPPRRRRRGRPDGACRARATDFVLDTPGLAPLARGLTGGPTRLVYRGVRSAFRLSGEAASGPPPRCSTARTTAAPPAVPPARGRARRAERSGRRPSRRNLQSAGVARCAYDAAAARPALNRKGWPPRSRQCERRARRACARALHERPAMDAEEARSRRGAGARLDYTSVYLSTIRASTLHQWRASPNRSKRSSPHGPSPPTTSRSSGTAWGARRAQRLPPGVLGRPRVAAESFATSSFSGRRIMERRSSGAGTGSTSSSA